MCDDVPAWTLRGYVEEWHMHIPGKAVHSRLQPWTTQQLSSGHGAVLAQKVASQSNVPLLTHPSNVQVCHCTWYHCFKRQMLAQKTWVQGYWNMIQPVLQFCNLCIGKPSADQPIRDCGNWTGYWLQQATWQGDSLPRVVPFQLLNDLRFLGVYFEQLVWTLWYLLIMQQISTYNFLYQIAFHFTPNNF